jgi:hypothetical protein
LRQRTTRQSTSKRYASYPSPFVRRFSLETSVPLFGAIAVPSPETTNLQEIRPSFNYTVNDACAIGSNVLTLCVASLPSSTAKLAAVAKSTPNPHPSMGMHRPEYRPTFTVRLVHAPI